MRNKVEIPGEQVEFFPDGINLMEVELLIYTAQRLILFVQLFVLVKLAMANYEVFEI